jgi:hypothetical protein
VELAPTVAQGKRHPAGYAIEGHPASHAVNEIVLQEPEHLENCSVKDNSLP